MYQTMWPAWRCPHDQRPLQDTGNALQCSEGHQFTRVKNIPRFVRDSNYVEGFGAQWNRYRLTQLDSYTKKTITRDRALRCLGQELASTISGKCILECGCGAGRFTEVLLQMGARVVSLDLSDAVEANQDNLPQNDFHRIVQADITNLPFEPHQFDIVFCLGVVQHTPEPEGTIEALYAQVKPGGALVLDHYSYGLSWFTKTAPLFRHYLKRLPPHKGIAATERIVDAFLPLHKKVRHYRLGQMLVSRISPVLCYYHVYPELSDSQQREWAILDTHDYLTDWYKHKRTRRQIMRMLEKMGLERIWCEYGGNGVEARGFRPSTRCG